MKKKEKKKASFSVSRSPSFYFTVKSLKSLMYQIIHPDKEREKKEKKKSIKKISMMS